MPQRTPDETRNRLLEAGAELFAAQGFHGTTVREIAERAGVNLAAGHYHFGSKRDLYLEVFRAHFGRVRDELRQRGAAPDPAQLAHLSPREAAIVLRERIRAMEEVDFCDRVSLIDAGRLIVDATPAEMRQRFSDGYHITVTAPETARREVLATLGPDATIADDGTIGITTGTLEPALLRRLGSLGRQVPGAEVRIADVPMTEVFRRALREAAA